MADVKTVMGVRIEAATLAKDDGGWTREIVVGMERVDVLEQ